MSFGYWNRILRIDLSTKKITEEEVGDGLYELFLGGAGLATKILWNEVTPEVKPLDAGNRLIF